MSKASILSIMAMTIASIYAGGFFVELGNPEANTEAKAKGAVLVARLTGCHQPEKAAVTATAEGIVNGKRESIALKAVPLKTKGMYAITREWPAQGTWAVKLVAIDADRTTSTVVRMGANGFDRASAKYFHGTPPAEQVDALLAGKPAKKSVKTAAL